MIRCWYLTFLLILATPLYCLADESSNQGISYFHTDSYSQQGQDYYIHVHKKNQASELIKHTMLDDLEKLDRIASFRTRFIIQNIGELEREIFHSPKTYEFINRKSEFEIISKNFFQATRKVLFISIHFKMKVDTLDSKSDNSAYNLFLKNSPFTKKPQFVVYQKMSDYSFFVTGSRVDFAFYKLETGKYLVEVIGQIGVKKSAPSFVDYKMIKDFPEKMKYLKNSLAKVFISSKL